MVAVAAAVEVVVEVVVVEAVAVVEVEVAQEVVAAQEACHFVVVAHLKQLEKNMKYFPSLNIVSKRKLPDDLIKAVTLLYLEDNEHRPQLSCPNASGSGNGQSKKALINLSSLKMKERKHIFLTIASISYHYIIRLIGRHHTN